MQADPIKPALKAPEIKRLKLNCDDPISNLAFKFNLRRFNEDTGAPMALKPMFDGAFLSMKIGGLDFSNPMGLADALKEQYIIFSGRFTLMGFCIEIDMSIKPGSMEEGGGLKFSFYFSWSVVGSVSLLELGGHMDLVPMDISKLMVGRCKSKRVLHVPGFSA